MPYVIKLLVKCRISCKCRADEWRNVQRGRGSAIITFSQLFYIPFFLAYHLLNFLTTISCPWEV